MTDAPPNLSHSLVPLPSASESPGNSAVPNARRRMLIRAFVLLVVVVITIDVAPLNWTFLSWPKDRVSTVIEPIGLWQGDWGMFAPSPYVTNGWLSVELVTETGQRITWDSKFWNKASGWEKFYQFRHINFLNRLSSPWYVPAADDYTDYLARTIPIPAEESLASNPRQAIEGSSERPRVVEAKLYYNTLRLMQEPDEPLPKRDEARWMVVSEIIAKRAYP